MKTVDVYWSFRSPYSYLATPEMLELKQRYNVQINLRVVFPIAIRDPNILFSKGSAIKAKYILLDWERRAEYLGLPHAWPSPDPIVMELETLTISDEQPYIYELSYLGVESQRNGLGIEFAAEVSKLIFGGTENWNEGDHLKLAAQRAGLDLESMKNNIVDEDSYLNEIHENQERLEAAGHWGVPTLVFDGEPFFGQDRIKTLCWRLDQKGLRKS